MRFFNVVKKSVHGLSDFLHEVTAAKRLKTESNDFFFDALTFIDFLHEVTAT